MITQHYFILPTCVFLCYKLGEARTKVQSTAACSYSLQKELSLKTATLSSQLEELKKLQHQHRIDSQQVSQLKQEVKEKQSTIASLQDRVSLLCVYV